MTNNADFHEFFSLVLKNESLGNTVLSQYFMDMSLHNKYL